MQAIRVRSRISLCKHSSDGGEIRGWRARLESSLRERFITFAGSGKKPSFVMTPIELGYEDNAEGRREYARRMRGRAEAILRGEEPLELEEPPAGQVPGERELP